jgi:5-methylthioadenosine/S-adenosylhomocysteine deaminase|tara:strand:+ start:120 stop:1481 length:1362 start_codon:yes stop_codon:yes gene_type:complete
MSSLLIYNGVVVTLGEGDHTPRLGWVYVSDSHIKQLGNGEAPPAVRNADTTIDVGGNVVMPGLINAHTHLFQTFARGTGDDLPLLEWIDKAILPVAENITSDEIYAAAKLGLIENIRSGATSVLEHQYIRADGADEAVCRAALEVGSRMVLARGWTDLHHSSALVESIDEFTSATEILHREWDGADARIRIETGPVAPWGCSDEGTITCRSLANQLGCGIHTHCAETQAEVAMGLERNGLRHVEWLDQLGILGPDTQLAHTVWVDEHELDLIANSGASVVHCPVSNMYLASGVAPIAEMLRRNITVALATDGPGSNNSQDMFEGMKAAILLQKVHHLDAGVLSPIDVLRMACHGGSSAIGEGDSLGRLEEGCLADIIVVDLATPFSTPVHDTHSALVFNASARDVRTVVIGGRVVLRDGRFTTLDEHQALVAATESCRGLFDRAGLLSEVNQL